MNEWGKAKDKDQVQVGGDILGERLSKAQLDTGVKRVKTW